MEACGKHPLVSVTLVARAEAGKPVARNVGAFVHAQLLRTVLVCCLLTCMQHNSLMHGATVSSINI